MIDLALAAVGAAALAGIHRVVDYVDERRYERLWVEAQHRELTRFYQAQLALHQEIVDAATDIWQLQLP